MDLTLDTQILTNATPSSQNEQVSPMAMISSEQVFTKKNSFHENLVCLTLGYIRPTIKVSADPVRKCYRIMQ